MRVSNFMPTLIIPLTKFWMRTVTRLQQQFGPYRVAGVPYMLILLLVSLAAFQILFLGLFLLRYSIENVRGEVESRAREATVA